MSGERSSETFVTKAEIEERTAQALARAQRRAAQEKLLRQQASQPQVPPSTHAERTARPQQYQAQTPVRRTTRTTGPISAPTPAAPRMAQAEPEPAQTLAVTENERKKLGYPARAAVIVGVVALALLAGNKFGAFDSSSLAAGINTAGFIGGGESNSSDDIILPTAMYDGALGPDSCRAPGSAVASMRVSGNYALHYQLKTPDDAVAIPAEYLDELPENQKDDETAIKEKDLTLSGYPEMTIHDLILEVYACEKPTTAAIKEVDGKSTIIAPNIDFSAKLVLPPEQSNPVQTEAYMTDDEVITENTIFTWPASTFLSPNAEVFKDESVQAAKDAHKLPEQRIGVFNTAVETIIASSSNISPDSKFNSTIEFRQDEIKNLHQAIKKGLRMRLGENKGWEGDSIKLTPLISDARPSLISTEKAPEDRFLVTEGEVTVGYFKPDSEDSKKE